MVGVRIRSKLAVLDLPADGGFDRNRALAEVGLGQKTDEQPVPVSADFGKAIRMRLIAASGVRSSSNPPVGEVRSVNVALSRSNLRTSRVDYGYGLSGSERYDALDRLVGVSETGSGGGFQADYRYGSSDQLEQGPGGSYGYGSDPAEAPEATTLGGVTTSERYDAGGEEVSGRRSAGIRWAGCGRLRRVL